MDVLLHAAMQFHIGLSSRFCWGDVFETLVPDRITLPVVGSRDRSTDMKLFDTTAFIDMKNV
jgi:hypothetical protein